MTDFLDANLEFSHAASVNADVSNWDWDPIDARWEPHKKWQQFANKWRNVDDQIFHTESRVLNLGLIPELSTNYRILIRDCYVKAEEMVWEQAVQWTPGGVILTGQPGIGKSCFIWYLLVRLLRMKQPVLLHLKLRTSLLFWDGAAYTAPSDSAGLPIPYTDLPFIWSLIDTEEKEEPPLLATTALWCFPVQAPSPRENRYQVWKKRRSAILTGFPLWGRDELAVAVRLAPRFSAFWSYLDRYWKDFTHKENVPEAPYFYYHTVSLLRGTSPEKAPKSTDEAFDIILDTLISLFGPIPRDVITGINQFPIQAQAHEEALRIRLSELEDIVWEVASKRQFPNTSSSHRIVSVDPIGEIGKPEGWTVKFKSGHIGEALSERLFQESENDVRSFIRKFTSMPEGRALAGLLFEPLVHRDITQGVTPCSWTFRKMHLRESGRSETRCFVYEVKSEGSEEGDGGDIPGFSNIPRKQVKFPSDELPKLLANDEYYVPLASNFPLIDSFIVDLDFTAWTAHLWVLQITTSEKHDGSKQGYVKIRKIIETIGELFKKNESDQPPPGKKLKGQGGKPKGKPSVSVHYVLVCPDHEVKPGLKWELPKGWDEGIGRTDHRGDGYLLKFPLIPLHQ